VREFHRLATSAGAALTAKKAEFGEIYYINKRFALTEKNKKMICLFLL